MKEADINDGLAQWGVKGGAVTMSRIRRVTTRPTAASTQVEVCIDFVGRIRIRLFLGLFPHNLIVENIKKAGHDPPYSCKGITNKAKILNSSINPAKIKQ